MAAADSVVVSIESLASDDPRDVVDSNTWFVNALLERDVDEAEIPADALRSYYVDFYLAEMANGGFAVFVHNARWHPKVVACVREGLRAMGAAGHLGLFERGAERVAQLDPERLRAFLDEPEFLGENPTRDLLDQGITAEFRALARAEDLSTLNAEWLRGLPGLAPLPLTELVGEVVRRSSGGAEAQA